MWTSLVLRRHDAPPVDGVQALRAGDRVGAYRILAPLGQGGMGAVYVARPVRGGDLVALKLLRLPGFECPILVHALPTQQQTERDAADLAALSAQLAHEAHIVSRLSHPGIVRLLDWGRVESQFYLAMELVRGMTLHQYLLENGLLAPGVAIEIAVQVAGALAYARNVHRVIHRDIKPENMLIETDGRVRLADFGMARVHEENGITTQHFLGSPHYLAPERLRGESSNHQSDIYALGVALYRMTTGFLPFWADNMPSLMYQTLHAPIILPSERNPLMPPKLEQVIMKAMERKPERRYATAEDMVGALLATGITPRPADDVRPLVLPRDTGEALDRLDRRVHQARERVSVALQPAFRLAAAGAMLAATATPVFTPALGAAAQHAPAITTAHHRTASAAPRDEIERPIWLPEAAPPATTTPVATPTFAPAAQSADEHSPNSAAPAATASPALVVMPVHPTYSAPLVVGTNPAPRPTSTPVPSPVHGRQGHDRNGGGQTSTHDHGGQSGNHQGDGHGGQSGNHAGDGHGGDSGGGAVSGSGTSGDGRQQGRGSDQGNSNVGMGTR